MADSYINAASCTGGAKGLDSGVFRSRRGFFGAFPGYRNVFEAISGEGKEITIAGQSFCPGYPELEGQALWAAVVHGDQVVKWCVYEDTAEVRQRLGLAKD
jgi:hypothetical protein